MEFDLMTSGGIATITAIVVQYIKKKMEFDPDHRLYSLIFIGFGFGISAILAAISMPLFNVDLNTAIQNGLIGFITATFGYQLIKGTGKAFIKK